jgi:hypothetical protein
LLTVGEAKGGVPSVSIAAEIHEDDAAQGNFRDRRIIKNIVASSKIFDRIQQGPECWYRRHVAFVGDRGKDIEAPLKP